jgi:hypothetical protein
LQIEEYFHTVRGLPNQGLNPYNDSNEFPMKENDLIELFGQKRVFRTTNPNLDPVHLQGLKKLYWQCYGTDHVSNNEFQLWFVKGFIVDRRGEKLNWCAAAARTSRERNRRLLLAKARSGEIGMSELSSFGGHGSLGVYERGDSKLHILDCTPTATGICSFGVATSDLQSVHDVLSTCSELLEICQGEVVKVKAARTSMREKLFALELNMEDRRTGILETQESIASYESDLTAVEKKIKDLERE